MAEIDRVYLSIDAFFKCFGDPARCPEEMEKLAGTIVKCAMGSMSRYSGIKPEDRDPKVEAMINKAEAAIRVLDGAVKQVGTSAQVENILVAAGWPQAEAQDKAKNPFAGETTDKVLTAENFKHAADLAMVARRACHPLDGEQPWDPPIDPHDALRDDEDPYSFSIFDSLVDPIQDLLPPLYQLSTEGWTPSDEEACENAALKFDRSLRGVVKELVGVTADDDKLIVYLKKQCAAAANIPSLFEGFPVTVQVLGAQETQLVEETVKCPVCGVRDGDCVTASGKRAKRPHRSRYVGAK